MNLRIYYLIVGIGAAIVSLATFFLVMLNQSFIIGGWMSPLWFSYPVILIAGCVSFMSLRLASEKGIWLC